MKPLADIEPSRGARSSSSPEALLQTIIATESDRIAARCRHFGACGGCQLQDVPLSVQLVSKQAMLVDVLHYAGVRDLPRIQTHSAEPWFYRNRVRMRVSGTDVGYSRRASHEFLAIEECSILSPLLWHAASELREFVRSGRARWPASTVSFELFGDAEEHALQLAVQLDATVADIDREAPRELRALCEGLRTTVPQLVGAGLSVAAAPDRSQSRRVQQGQRVEIAHWGEPALNYVVDGQSYRITRNAFFQVNRFLTEDMVRTVVGARAGDLAYDLFAGAGLFSVPLARRFKQVIAVEIGDPAASDLAVHLRACGPQHRGVRSTALDFLQRQSHRIAPNLIVLDPPRAGLGMATVRALMHANAREIVYVSCDAGTFARDARPMVDSGYTLASLHLFDLFPQTFHTETIAVFRKGR
jgi:23S rRNA (uracil1939-C5)-methyltransferase